MKNMKKLISDIWNDESGQGATEYILLLVIVVGVAMVFKERIMEAVNSKLADLSSSIGGVTSN